MCVFSEGPHNESKEACSWMNFRSGTFHCGVQLCQRLLVTRVSVCSQKGPHKQSPTAYIRMTFRSGTHLVHLYNSVLGCWWHVHMSKEPYTVSKETYVNVVFRNNTTHGKYVHLRQQLLITPACVKRALWCVKRASWCVKRDPRLGGFAQ